MDVCVYDCYVVLYQVPAGTRTVQTVSPGCIPGRVCACMRDTAGRPRAHACGTPPASHVCMHAGHRRLATCACMRDTAGRPRVVVPVPVPAWACPGEAASGLAVPLSLLPMARHGERQPPHHIHAGIDGSNGVTTRAGSPRVQAEMHGQRSMIAWWLDHWRRAVSWRQAMNRYVSSQQWSGVCTTDLMPP